MYEDIFVEALLAAASQKSGFILVRGGVSSGKSFAVSALFLHLKNVYGISIGNKVMPEFLTGFSWLPSRHNPNITFIVTVNDSMISLPQFLPYTPNSQIVSFSQAKFGLTKTDLQSLCIKAKQTWLERDFSRLLRFMSFMFSVDYDGYISFRHPEIAQVIKQKYFSRDLKLHLYDYVKKLDIRQRTYQQEILELAIFFEDWLFVISYIETHEQQLRSSESQENFNAIFLSMETTLQRNFLNKPTEFMNFLKCLGDQNQVSIETQLKVYLFLKMIKLIDVSNNFPIGYIIDCISMIVNHLYKRLEYCSSEDKVGLEKINRVLYVFLILLSKAYEENKNPQQAEFFSQQAELVHSCFDQTADQKPMPPGKEYFLTAEEAFQKCEHFKSLSEDDSNDQTIKWGLKAYKNYMFAEQESYIPVKTSCMKKISVLLYVAEAAKETGDEDKYNSVLKLIEMERESFEEACSDSEENDQIAILVLNAKLGNKAIEDERYEDAYNYLENPYIVFKPLAMQEGL